MTARLYLLPVLTFLPAVPVQSAASDVFARAIRDLGGTPVPFNQFPDTLDGFETYLRSCGVKHLSARTLTRPNHPQIAHRLGFTNFLPTRQWWPRGAALALIVDKLQAAAGEPIQVRNWWRPSAYNSDRTVGGASHGDHPTANAMDLDYPTEAGRKRAERWLRSLDRQMPYLRLSLGLGGRTTHVGIGSARGRREWHYADWVPAD